MKELKIISIQAVSEFDLLLTTEMLCTKFTIHFIIFFHYSYFFLKEKAKKFPLYVCIILFLVSSKKKYVLFSPYIVYIMYFPKFCLCLCEFFVLFFLIVHPKKTLQIYKSKDIDSPIYIFFSGRISTCGWRYEIVLCLYQCSLLPQMGWQNWKINYICNSNIFMLWNILFPKRENQMYKKIYINKCIISEWVKKNILLRNS